MDAANQCLDLGRMSALLAGDVDEEEQSAMAEHLNDCVECREKLAALAGGDDLLADVPNTAHNASSPDVRRLIDAIKQEQQNATVALDRTLLQDVSVNFLEPSERTECLGKIGVYDVISVIGQGGMGTVLKAQDPNLNRIVAIKVLSPQLASNAVARKRFLREAQSAAAVSHDHVVTIHAVDQSAKLPFIVMEFISGVSLADRIKHDGPLPLEKILRIGMQTASGLAAAHAQGLVHRDIKPSNILLENGVERVKITDFGLARALDDTQITQTGVVAGTPEYMSPEQAAGKTIDQKSDLFSLGCVLYAMCTGRSPFRASTVVDAIRRVCDDTPRPIRETNSEIPEWLVQIVDQLLDKDPARRISSATELADLLGGHLAHLQQPGASPRPESPVTLAKPEVDTSSRRRIRWAAALALPVLLLGSFGVSNLLRPTPPSLPNDSIATIGTLQSGTLEVQIRGTAIELTVSGNGVKKSFTKDDQEPAVLPVGVYDLALTNTRTNEVLRKGTISIDANERRRCELGIFGNHRPFPARRRSEAHHLDCDGSVKVVGLSTDGDRLLTATSTGTVTVWTRVNGDWHMAFVIGKNSGKTTPAAFSPDGATVATAGDDGVLWVWDAHTGKQFKSLPNAHDRPINHITFSSDGRFLVTACDDGTVKLWNCKTWEQLSRIIAHPDAVTCAALSPNGETMATCSDDGTVKLWDTTSQKCVHTLFGHTACVKCLTFSPDGKSLASAGMDTLLILWDVETGKISRRFANRCPVLAIGFSPVGNVLASADQDVIRLWDWKSGDPIDAFHAHWAYIETLAFSSDGGTLITGSIDYSAKLWQVPHRDAASLVSRPQPRTTFYYWDPNYFPSPITCSTDNVIAVGEPTKAKVTLWDMDGIRKIKDLVPDHAFLTDVLFFPDGRLVTSGSREHEPGVSIWSSETYQYEKHISLPKSPLGLAMTPDCRTLAATKAGISARLIDLESGETIRQIPTSYEGQEYGGHISVAFSPKGEILAVGTSLGFVILCDVITGKRLTSPLLHGESGIWSVAFSPDGKTLVSAGMDSTIKFWNVARVENPVELGRLSHRESVNTVAYSPDGSLFATVGGDVTPGQLSRLRHVAEVRLWDAATREMLVEFEGHSEAIWYARFSKDGKTLATSGRDCKVHLWDVEELLAYGAKTNKP